MAASLWEFRHQLAKIGRKPDASEWLVSSARINAYNNPRQVALFISAAMLAPPVFDRDADDAVNYGGMGALIGHELTHGFDGYGRRYDQHGVLTDWWTAKDDANFNERARCLADQYSEYEVLDGVHLDGEQTLAENISDAAGVRLAYAAYKRSRAKPEPKREGFTPEQRFFLSYATGSCEKATDAFLRDVASNDVHSWAKFRVNGVVSNLPEFREAFGCRKGQAMVREQMCRVW
jgi:putative endopeptidase